ncbi:MAG: hypothetical protein C4K49_06805 [Candidatus Thorarchaeota archaeon]|nr:MAG: hypothetical protein C4K49_06805 [Candidatus Thorarchaeota archaeon]
MNLGAPSKNTSEDLRGLQSVPRGFLRLVIARLLQSKEMSGTDIMDVLENRSQGKWRPSPGSIYPMLATMRHEGLIEAVGAGGRISTYRLSGKGQERFREVFRHKNQMDDRTRLHRLLWLQLLDPNDRAYFHMNAVSIAAEALASDMSELTQFQRRKLAARIGKAIEKLEQLADTMENGVKSSDGSENSSD